VDKSGGLSVIIPINYKVNLIFKTFILYCVKSSVI